MRLLAYDIPIPGGFIYSEYGQTWRGPMIEGVARNLLDYRSVNGKSRATYRECIEDVDCYQCQRLGNNPRFCTESTAGRSVISMRDDAPGLKPCAGCGAPIVG